MNFLGSKQLDDSGYVSNSITREIESLSLDCSSINENSNLQTINLLNSDTFDLQNVIRRKTNLKNENIRRETKSKLNGVNCTSTPYSKALINDEDFDIKLNEPSCSSLYVTPKSRKRKKCWPEFDSPDCYDHTPYININHDLETSTSVSSLNRHDLLKVNCTRKLLNDFSDGSLSDTDLDKKKKIRLEGTRSEPNSPERNQHLLSSPFNNSKLGLAEKNEMLYPKLRYRARPKKYNISTPQKIRQLVKEELLHANIPDISKPSQRISNFIRSSKNVDFFTLFTAETNNFHIIKKILFYLDPEDLESISNVSKRARCCIREIAELNSVLKSHLRHKKINKENVFVTKSSKLHLHESSILNTSNISLDNSCDRSFNKQLKSNNSLMKTQTCTNSSIETSPRKREWLKFVEASADLTPGQKLTRCGRCSNPAKVLNNIVLCTRRSCQFICCSKCCNPFCDSVQYLEKYSDIENMPTTIEFLSGLPPCSSNNNNTEDNRLKRPNIRLFLAECGNSNRPNELAFSHALNSNINNFNDRTENYNSLSNIFNFNITDNTSKPTLNDVFENRRTKSIRNYNMDIVTPESPPKINKHIPISSKSSKKNLRRL